MEMDKIKCFIGCGVPVYACNFRCKYCYLGQHPHPYEKGIIPFAKSAEYISKFFSIERMGGICYFNFCGSGETLMHPEVLDLVVMLVNQGHYADIITNGTLTKKFEEIVNRIPDENKAHLLIKFSFHYLELKRLDLMSKFVENVNIIKSAGISYTIEVTPHDELIPYIDEIKQFSQQTFGAYPQFTVARNEETKEIELLTNLEREEYKSTWGTFDSPMFDFKFDIFNKKRCEFCYAGKWSLQVDLATGDYYQCYGGDLLGNIKHLDRPINFRAIGKCRQPHCFNGHAYMTFGLIPELVTPTYASMRDRANEDGTYWLQSNTRQFFESKLVDSNDVLGEEEKKNCLRKNKYYKIGNYIIRGKRKIIRILKKILK